MTMKSRMIFILGGTCAGKSTLALHIAKRLNIFHVVPTDVVRQVMSSTVNANLMPFLSKSSYEETVYNGEVGLTFHLQRRFVLAGVEGMVARASREQFDLIVEGVHLHPSILDGIDMTDVDARFLAIRVADKDQHHQRLMVRQNSRRGLGKKYVENFDNIRTIQDVIMSEAHQYGVPLIDNSHDIEEVTDQLFSKDGVLAGFGDEL